MPGRLRAMNATMFTAAALSLALCTPGNAQTEPTAELRAKLTKKLAGKWIANAAWSTDLAAAKATATRRGKQIFAYFTRSYAP